MSPVTVSFWLDRKFIKVAVCKEKQRHWIPLYHENIYCFCFKIYVNLHQVYLLQKNICFILLYSITNFVSLFFWECREFIKYASSYKIWPIIVSCDFWSQYFHLSFLCIYVCFILKVRCCWRKITKCHLPLKSLVLAFFKNLFKDVSWTFKSVTKLFLRSI